MMRQPSEARQPALVHICGFRRGTSRILWLAPEQWTFSFYRMVASQFHPHWDLVHYRQEERSVIEDSFARILKEYPHDLLVAGWFELQLLGTAEPVVYLDASDSPRVKTEILTAGHRYWKTNLLKCDQRAYAERIKPLPYHPRWSLYMVHPGPRRLLECPPERDIEVTFRCSLHGRVLRNRVRGLEILAKSRRFALDGPEILPPPEYLEHLHRAKIGVSLFGIGIQCMRTYEILQAGGVAITEEGFDDLWMVDPPEDRKHLVLCRQDLSDLEPLVVRYLRDEEARRRIAKEGHDWYLRNCCPERYCRVLDHIIDDAFSAC